LLWAAIWLHEASGEEGYLKYVADNADQLGGTGWGMDQFSWDNKYAGVQLKVTKVIFNPLMPLPVADQLLNLNPLLDSSYLESISGILSQ